MILAVLAAVAVVYLCWSAYVVGTFMENAACEYEHGDTGEPPPRIVVPLLVVLHGPLRVWAWLQRRSATRARRG